MGEKTNRLSIFLIKGEVDSFDDVIDDGCSHIEITGLGRFYFEDSHDNEPDWVKGFFLNEIEGRCRIFTAGARGVFLVPVQSGDHERMFAISFGYGRHLLKDGVIEERFGLKVVLNSVEHTSLRSISKTSLGSIPKQSREQMSREGEAASFGIDIEQDLISEVTGRSKHTELGKNVTGKDSLSVSVKVDISDIKEFLPKCMRHYESDAYKEHFDWI